MADPTATFVLVHGAWHDGWCWHRVEALLREAGRQVVAVDLPFTGSDDDVRCVEETLDAVPGAAVLVGHSYGGVVITEAASGRSDVEKLVYVCAFAERPDEDADFAASLPPNAFTGVPQIVDGQVVADAARAPRAFYQLCEEDDARQAASRLRPMAPHQLTTRRPPAFDALPSLYVVCTEDQALHPPFQERMAARCTRMVRMASDHSPFLSAPGELAAILLREGA